MIIGVIGATKATPEIERIAQEIGEKIAQKGYLLICGGLGGVMEAACRGCKQNKGTTIGILPGDRKETANKWVDIPIVTAMSHARNAIIVRTADLLVAVGGAYGTLSEIALALVLNKPVIGIDGWRIEGMIRANSVEEIFKIIDNFKNNELIFNFSK